MDYTSLCLVSFILLLAYSGIDALLTRKDVVKGRHPLIGDPFYFTPRYVLNLIFAGKARKIVNQGYQKVSPPPLVYCFRARFDTGGR